MPSVINIPENYQYGDALGGLIGRFVNAAASTPTAVVVDMPHESVLAILQSVDPGLREDISDTTIRIGHWDP